MKNIPTLNDIREAYDRIEQIAHRTPILTNNSINEICGSEIVFKCENFQKAGAFKFRGASNVIFSLPESEAKKGVATHSSGNHAGALALASKMRDIKATIIMPKTAKEIKKKAVQSYGADIIFCEPTLKSREETLDAFIKESGAHFVHPYNDYRIIAGQATAAMELIEDFGKFDYIIAPVGGGGLLSGTSLSSHYLSEKTKVIGAEPKGADDAYRSFKDGKIHPSENPDTICDGLLTSLGDKTFNIIKKYVDAIITVDDKTIVEAMRLIWERMKIIVEPSSAVPLAVVLNNKKKFEDKQIGIILSGGNVDLNRLPF
jgi:threonine dehydratase